ncbi:MAG: 30S ribosomal protein S6 [bacterium]
MKLYEFTYLISPELGEEEVKDFQEKIISLVQAEGGILTEISAAAKKKLAYPIKKKTEAFYATLAFELDQSKIQALEKKLKQESQILRCLLMFKPPRKISAKPRRRLFATPSYPSLTPSEEKQARPLQPKAELGEIDKKLEEILKG